MNWRVKEKEGIHPNSPVFHEHSVLSVCTLETSYNYMLSSLPTLMLSVSFDDSFAVLEFK